MGDVLEARLAGFTDGVGGAASIDVSDLAGTTTTHSLDEGDVVIDMTGYNPASPSSGDIPSVFGDLLEVSGGVLAMAASQPASGDVLMLTCTFDESTYLCGQLAPVARELINAR